MREARRPGRKPQPANQGQRVSLGLKVTPAIKNELDAAAKANGRTQSQEAEVRIEQTFRDQKTIEAGLNLAFGPELAALLLLIGNRVRTLSTVANFLTGSEHHNTNAWLHNPYVFDQTVQSISAILAAMRPPGDPDYFAQPGVIPDFADMPKEGAETMGRGGAENDLYCVAFSHPKALPDLRGKNKFFENIRQALGDEVLLRIAQVVEPQQS